jgi:hypothetical protein
VLSPGVYVCLIGPVVVLEKLNPVQAVVLGVVSLSGVSNRAVVVSLETPTILALSVSVDQED